MLIYLRGPFTYLTLKIILEIRVNYTLLELRA